LLSRLTAEASRRLPRDGPANRPEFFFFRGVPYGYFSHPYNQAGFNERTVEVSIVLAEIQSAGEKRVLEVGNVLSHYFPHRHDVVDKFERASGVLQEDIVDFRPPHPYSLIVSISTLEHVGWDESASGRDPDKVLRAVDSLRRYCLGSGGRLVATVPVGYNQALDEHLRTGTLRFDAQYALRRISLANEWVEVPWKEALPAAYGDPFPCANAILVGLDG
jgi:hypothetical protein